MASVTINFDPAAAARIATAFGSILDLKDVDGNPRDATTADYKAFVITKTKQMVKNYERQVIEATEVDLT
jgi:hypothetical protein